MYKDKPFGLYKYGYIEDLDKIDEKNLYNNYKKIINEAKIDIFVSGNFETDEIINKIRENENIKKLQEREDKHNLNSEETERKEKVEINNIQTNEEVS